MARNFTENTTDAVHAGDPTTYDGVNGMCVVAWQRFPTGALPNGTHLSVSKYASSAGFMTGYRNGGAGAYWSTHVYYIQNNNASAGPSGWSQESNTWRHFVSRWTGSTLSFWKDGVQSPNTDRSSYSGSTTNTSQNLTIGNASDGSSHAAHDLAEVAIFKRDLTLDEIDAMAAAASPSFFGPDDHYDFVAGTTTEYSKGAAENHADTAVGTPTYVEHPEKSHVCPSAPLFFIAPSDATYNLPVATETDTAQELTASKTVELPTASETDTAQALAASKTASLPVASETDTAQGLSASKTASLPIATETDTAQDLGATKSIILPPASETDTAQELGASKSIVLPIATETDTAQDLGATKSIILPPASETDTAQSLALDVGGQTTYNLPVATETDTAQELSAAKTIDLPVATETDAAQDLAASKSIILPPASETDTAQTLTVDVGGQTTYNLPVAIETTEACGIQVYGLSAIIPDHYPITAPNLVVDPHIPDSTNWVEFGGAVFDPAVTRTADGSGSLRMETYVVDQWRTLNFFTLPSKGRYTMSFFARSVAPGVFGSVQIGLYNAGGSFIRNQFVGFFGTDGSGDWQEQAWEVYVDTDEAPHITINIIKSYGTGQLWVDDVYFGEQEYGTVIAPTAKPLPWLGGRAQLDSLGNLSLLNQADTEFEPFFPIAIYSDFARADWSIYSAQGFNCVKWPTVDNQVQKAVDAGMKASLDITHYLQTSNGAYGNIALLESRLRDIIDQDLLRHLTYFYIDNETFDADRSIVEAVVETVRKIPKFNCLPSHPINVLQGNTNTHQTYRHLFDAAGSYLQSAADATTGTQALSLWKGLDNIEYPAIATFALISGSTNAWDFRFRTYASLIGGAKGIAYFRDGGSGGDITTKDWWPDVPYFAAEVAAAAAVLRTSHFISWTVASSNANVMVGRRTYNGLGHLILLNMTTSPQTVSLTPSGLGYTISSATNVVDESDFGAVATGTLTVTLPALGINAGTAIVRLNQITSDLSRRPIGQAYHGGAEAAQARHG